jgi:DNA-binding GntR family transcriptional regulator
MGSVYETVRHAILTGELEEGMVLSQVALAERLGVSRTPLREALASLQVEGLVDGGSNGRIRVSRATMENLEAHYAMRISLESVAVAVGASMFRAHEVDALKQLAAMLEREPDMDRWFPLHREFHRLLVSKVKDRFTVTIQQLQDGTERYRRLYSRLEPVSYWRPIAAGEHAAIVGACAEGDAETAACELARHLARTALSVIAVQDPLYDPVILRAAIEMVARSADGARVLEPLGNGWAAQVSQTARKHGLAEQRG